MKLPQLSPKQFFKLRFIDPDDKTKFFTDSGTSTAYLMPLPLREWVHLAAEFDDQAHFRRIFLNGVRVADETPVGQRAQAASVLAEERRR